MGNPFFGIMGGGGRPNMMHQFQQFMSQMQGKDPNAIINEMVQSGKLSQEERKPGGGMRFRRYR